MSDRQSVSDRRLISTESAKDAIARALSLNMGQGRRHSISDVASATRLPDEDEERCKARLYSYIRETDRRTPPGDVLLRLCDFFGPDFTSKVLGDVGQGAHYLEPRPGEPGYVIARLAKGTGEFAWRGADHRYCHVDRGHLEPVADEMIQILQPFSSKASEA